MLMFKASGVNKKYGEVVALENMDFSLQESEIHYLVGANGCGKSTLCKIISGVVSPDSGTLEIGDTPLKFFSPDEAKRQGISVVYQELSLIPQLTIEENILLGIEPKKEPFGLVDREGCTAAALRQLEPFKSVLNLDESYVKKKVSEIPINEQQIVEIAKALAREPKLVIFDEATASLHKQQVDVFFSILRDLKTQGVSTIVISHKMEEITEIGDRVTIMRSGHLVKTVPVKEITGEEIINLMVGDQQLLKRKRNGTEVDYDVKVLEVQGLKARNINNVSFSLHRGEVLGLGGLQGQGQAEILLSLFGINPVESGILRLNGKEVTIASTVDAIKHSLAYISGDRKKAGVFLVRSIFENLVLSFLIKTKRKIFSRKKMEAEIMPFINKIGMKFGKLTDEADSLSGGNQQKVVIGRWLMTKPAVLLLDDSTKGIDVRASKDFYDIMHTLCKEGMSVIWHSSEDIELLNNTDRILVIDGGKIVDELRDDRLNEVELYRSALDSKKVNTGEMEQRLNK
ncbi:MAG: sugar ABC transporter ATP-binding protein [Spirochaetia bacterium]|nr:sugar ABC transporter ATP-binding protein [Spirochaetia bacterium]